MTVQTISDDAGRALLEPYQALKPSLPGAGADWLADLRDDGATAFGARGLPTPKVEDWRYTSLAPLARTAFDWHEPDAALDAARLPALVYGRESACRLVLVNGRLRRDLSTLDGLPDGATLLGFAEAAADRPALLHDALGGAGALGDQPFAALNTAFMRDGFVLDLEPGVVMDRPVEVLAVGTGGAQPPVYHPRNLIVAGADSRATVIEHHVGLCIGAYFANVVTEIIARDGAVVRHCKVQDESREAFHIAATNARIGRGAMLDSFAFAIGGRLSRNEIRVTLAEPGAHCRLHGAYLMRGTQHCDNTTVIDHAAPETNSHELYKGVLDDQASGVFQGKIVVQPDSQKIDGHQMNRALLLSDKATINSKPELKIYADDVKCSHGATAGELDDDALFYLRSRGVPEPQARRLLVEAFLNEVIDGIALTGMRLPLEQNVARWMTAGAGKGGAR
jgi:Fe-S cluster assembly protein SufD